MELPFPNQSSDISVGHSVLIKYFSDMFTSWGFLGFEQRTKWKALRPIIRLGSKNPVFLRNCVYVFLLLVVISRGKKTADKHFSVIAPLKRNVSFVWMQHPNKPFFVFQHIDTQTPNESVYECVVLLCVACCWVVSSETWMLVCMSVKLWARSIETIVRQGESRHVTWFR